MTQTLDPIPFDETDAVLCCYVNSASKIQVVRITNIQNWYFERVVFPGQRLMFEASVRGQLEVHSGAMASSILEDTIPCTRLMLEQADDELNSLASSSAEVMQPVPS
ncbi:MAG: DUF1830 domain-containing protein [Leptolyngbya sp. SIO3F4]|nr:DUF1830 domain-containing protein [Leptolyngbya sp. SIO3F4]